MTTPAITSATASLVTPSLARVADAPVSALDRSSPGAIGTPNVAAPVLPGDAAAKADQDPIHQALEEVRAAISPVAQNLLFSIDDDTGHTVIKIVDSSTEEVIKQIPSEEILAIAKALDKLQGLLIKQEA